MYLTLDIDHKNWDIDYTRKQLEPIASNIDIFKTKHGYHVIAFLKGSYTREQIETLRIRLGDDIGRVRIDRHKQKYNRQDFQQVLFTTNEVKRIYHKGDIDVLG